MADECAAEGMGAMKAAHKQDSKLVRLRDEMLALPIVEKIDLARQLFSHGKFAMAATILRLAADEADAQELARLR